MTTQVVILGSHRSGTSALAGLMERMGAYVGAPSELMTPDAYDNPKGYFERLDVTELDEQLLVTLDAAWDRPPRRPLSEGFAAVDFERRARAIVEKLAAHPVSVMKDPRQCLLFDAWRPLLPNPRVLIMVRNPMEIARSQARRDATPIEVTLALWELYMTRTIHSTAGLDRRVVRHVDMLSNPDAFARSVAEPFGLDPTQAAGWVEPDLHRHRASEEESLAALNADQRDLYDALMGSSGRVPAWTRPLSPGSHAALEQHRARFEAARTGSPPPRPWWRRLLGG